MATLKTLRMRIASVKSTQKITSAMKMVAAAKLRRAQEQAEAARPYATRMGRMLGSLAGSMTAGAGAPKLLAGTGADKVHLLVVCTSDRGLCGGFNSSIVRLARAEIRKLQAEGKTVKILCVGRKGRDQLRRDFASLIVGSVEEVGRKRMTFAEAQRVSDKVLAMFDAGEFDVAALYYARFKSAITQVPTRLQLVPFVASGAAAPDQGASYEYEPEEGEILAALLPRNLAVQVYGGLLENAASEQGARMSAMDSATRNAGDMIKKLTLNYNRSRQASITKELIEIISGAEAV
ncbi:MAG: F0F1 ATP synthase subunit gamma [Alphaproteobacteria bacterium]|nr:F0F1 ATP synthase subunit gamma [Alphaproteobacteria bacterium]